jgi:alkylation response protein AidB-like acyl-CoA dehydrogenase
VTDSGTLELLRSTARSAFGESPSLAEAGELGWLSLLTPVDHGGSGWNVAEACILAEEAGRSLSTVNWSGAALAAAGLSSSSLTARLVPAIMMGEARALFVSGHLVVAEDGVAVATGWVTGTHEDAASLLVVASEGAGLVAAFTATSGRHVTPDPLTFDTTNSIVRIELGAQAPTLLDANQLPWLVGAAQLLSCADTIGALGGAIDVVTEHLVNRKAFGAPLASFQVLQHRLVDLSLLHVSAQALLSRAARVTADRSEDAFELIDAAHIYVQARSVVALDDCIQLAGAIGFTWEFPLHMFLRRAVANARAIRSGSASRERLAAAKKW